MPGWLPFHDADRWRGGRRSLLYHSRIRSPCRPRLTVSTEASTTPECSHQALAAAFEESNGAVGKKSTESRTGVTDGVDGAQRKGRARELAEDHSASRASKPVKLHRPPTLF